MNIGYDIERILNLLPHRYPFILVDRVLELEPGVKIRALKNVTINEPFFQGHFPDKPIMPGLLIVEGMVQAGGLLLVESLPVEIHRQVCFSGVDRARFRAPVIPGDQLIFEVEIVKQRSRVVKMSAYAFVDKKRVAEAKLMALIGG
ncbi:MAG: 3-hydroxyacyl-ACP dehydratase FabZ [Desulfobacteraceae bacterium]|nr:3-hydroxyacyl-ACP dehydratase FabZ [Desulfobacteraceae bacterium]MBC2755311.1 3-hydroxyacyl-ACP dehydratase FabZ [Desulfobacteraceae bacterium]